MTSNITYMLGQAQGSPSSKANFLHQTGNELCKAIRTLWDMAQKTINGQLVSFKYECLQTALDIKEKDGRYFSESTGRYVVIDDSFSFKTKQHVVEMQELLLQYEGDEQIDVIISENPGNMTEKNMTSPSGNVRVIHQSKLIDYFGLKQIQFISKSKEEEP